MVLRGQALSELVTCEPLAGLSAKGTKSPSAFEGLGKWLWYLNKT